MSLRIAVMGAVGSMGSIVMDVLKERNNIAVAVVEPSSFDYAKNKYPEYEVTVSLVGLKPKPDVVIDFSLSSAVEDTVQYCKALEVPLVECVTGLSDKTKFLIEEASANIPIFFANNTSTGVAILRKALNRVAALVKPSNWRVDIIEHHGAAKLDKPSGTSLSIIKDLAQYKFVEIFDDGGARGPMALEVNKLRGFRTIETHSIRSASGFCEHKIMFTNQNEIVELSHRVGSKVVFAQGAIRAALWLLERQKPGLYDMNDILEDLSGNL